MEMNINDFYIPHHETWEMSKKYTKDYQANPLFVQAVRYYDRYLLQKAMSVFEFTIPDSWAMNYLLYNLYVRGFVCVTKFKKYGVVPQWCTISGFNIYYNPSKCLIANPYLPENESKEVELGVDGELLVLTPDYRGILDLVNTHSEMLANALCAVNTNLYNSRLAYMFYAKNKAQAESYKKMYDEIGTGSPAVFIDSKLMQEDASGNLMQPFLPFNADLQSNYITSQVLEDMRRIEHMFAQKIGLPNMNSEKKERMNQMEVNKTDIESVSNVCLWHDTLQESVNKVNKMFPELNISFDYRFPITAYETMEEMEGDVLQAEGTMRTM